MCIKYEENYYHLYIFNNTRPKSIHIPFFIPISNITLQNNTFLFPV